MRNLIVVGYGNVPSFHLGRLFFRYVDYKTKETAQRFENIAIVSGSRGFLSKAIAEAASVLIPDGNFATIFDISEIEEVIAKRTGDIFVENPHWHEILAIKRHWNRAYWQLKIRKDPRPTEFHPEIFVRAEDHDFN